MNNRVIKRLLSFILCLVCVLSQLDGVNAIASESAKELTYEQINRKIVDAYENHVAPTEIFESLSKKEVQVLRDYYAGTPTATVLSLNEEENEEISYIDSLANQYYNELEKRGAIENISEMDAQEIDELLESIELPEMPNQSRAGICFEPDDVCAIFKSIGYTYTLAQISKQLVAIGSKISLGFAFPVIELIALVVGAVIVTMSVAIIYCAASVVANDLIIGWYLYNEKQIKAASKTTAQVVADTQSGTTFWRAHRVDFGGLGGVAILNSISETEALGYVVADKESKIFPEVFCINKSTACDLAKLAFGGTATPPEAHRSDGQILNMQHVHAIKPGGVRGHTHIFFAIPYCV